MAKRRTRTRARPVIEDVVEEELDLEEDELEDEEPEPAPKPRRRRARRAAVTKPEPEVEDDEEPAPKPRRRRATKKVEPEPEEDEKPTRRRRATKKVEPEPEEDVAEVSGLDRDDVISVAKGLLDAGITLAISKVGNHYLIRKADALTAVTQQPTKGRRAKNAMSWAEFEEIAATDEFLELNERWLKMSFEDKVKAAKAKNVVWDEHEDPKINNMRLTMAYRKKLGIIKWLPEYQNKATRDRLLHEGIEAEPIEDDEG